MHDNKKAVVVRRLGKPASRVSQMNLQRVRVLNNKQNDFSFMHNSKQGLRNLHHLCSVK